MKRGILPLVPVELFGPSSDDTVNLWKKFFLAPEGMREEWRSLLKGDEKSLGYWPSCLIGMARTFQMEEVWYAAPSVLPAVKRSLEVLKKEGVEIIPFKYPPIKNLEFLKKSIEKAVSVLGLSKDQVESRVSAWATLRTALKRLDGVQTRSLALSSRSYLEALHSVPDPGLSLPTLLRETELKVAMHYKGMGQDFHVRIGILGIPPFDEGFYRLVDDLKALVVYDEAGLESFPLGHFNDLTLLYNSSSLPYGIKVKKDKLEKEIKDRAIDAFLYCADSQSDVRSNVSYLESELKIPFYIFGIKDTKEQGLLEYKLLKRFLDGLMEKRERGKKR